VPGAAHVYQHEHAGLRGAETNSGNILQRLEQKFAPSLAESANAALGVGRHGERDERSLLDESRQTKQHAHRDRFGVEDELSRTDQPAAAPSRHGMRF
jgi:hypothetical protein